MLCDVKLQSVSQTASLPFKECVVSVVIQAWFLSPTEGNQQYFVNNKRRAFVRGFVAVSG